MSGRILLQKNCVLNSSKKVGQSIQLSNFFSSECLNKIFWGKYPWLSTGFSISSVERVGFRIEYIRSSIPEDEVLIFEILTNGSISPRFVLHEAALALTCKFSAIANVALSSKSYININQKNFCKKLSFFSKKTGLQCKKHIGKTFYSVFNFDFLDFQESFSLDLENLLFSKERYFEFRILGFQTSGQLLERLLSDFYLFPYTLEQQRWQAFFRLGIFSLFNFL